VEDDPEIGSRMYRTCGSVFPVRGISIFDCKILVIEFFFGSRFVRSGFWV